MQLLILYALLALAISFACSVAEAVLLSVTPAYVASLEMKGSRTGKRLQALKENIDQPLAAILTLNTIAHTVGAVGVGAQAAIVFGEAHVGVASAILTLLILILSEIIPKTIGAVYWRRLSSITAVFVRFLIVILYPLVVVAEAITNRLSKEERALVFSREEFKAMADLGKQEGALAAKESRILKNSFKLQTTKVSDVMTPYEVVMQLQQDATVREAVPEDVDMPFSRLPLYDEDPGKPDGYVLKTDLLMAKAEDRFDIPVSSFRRDLLLTPEDTPLLATFDTLLDKREQIAAAINKNGQMTGIVTLEDVVETLLGSEIVDEVDPAEDMRQLAAEQKAEKEQQSKT
jgi:CBS domain containing-hemolysin-like protein